MLSRHYDLPDAYLAKHLQAMVRAGLLRASSGPKGGFRLARPADRIAVLDIVEAIEGAASPFSRQEIRQCGRAAAAEDCRSPCAVAIVIQAYDAWRVSLANVSVADLINRVPASARKRGVRLLTEPSYRSHGTWARGCAGAPSRPATSRAKGNVAIHSSGRAEEVRPMTARSGRVLPPHAGRSTRPR